MGRKTSLVILAGGYSSRMGYPKLILPFNDSETFIERIISTYQPILKSNILLILNNKVWKENKGFFESKVKNAKIILNNYPELERSFSIKLGLENINTEQVFIQDSDNPFTNEELIISMMKAAPANGYVVPKMNHRAGHPVLLCGETINKVKNIKSSQTMKDILKSELRTEVKTNDPSIFQNINNPIIYKINLGKSLSNELISPNMT